jgi:isoleucyl-tRNA synthetase
MYQNLKGALPVEQQLESVHFHRIPLVDERKIDVGIERSVSVLQRAVDLGRKVRAKVRDALKAQDGASLSERVPLKHMLVTHFESAEIDALKACEKYLLSSSGLNVQSVTYVTDFKGVIKFSSQPNMKTVGRKAGKEVRHARAAIEGLDQDVLSKFHLYSRAAASDEGKEGVRECSVVKV